MKDVYTLDERMHQLDLQTIEKVEKLILRLQTGLGQWKKCTQHVAQQESLDDFLTVGAVEQEENAVTPNQAIEALKEEQIKSLLALKKAVWDSSNALKKDHERRNVIKAQYEEKEELEMEVE
tara:strand:+ start:897 stop:1262 length:366 start_codon:yes stop_codon:yes gene_type:complete